MEHDFLALYPAKAIEYLLGLGFLVSFAFFWRYLNGRARPSARNTGTRSSADTSD